MTMPRLRAWGSLLACCTALSTVWLVVLPWYASQPRMAAHLQWLDDNKVDPSAMFYTELEAMDPILERLEANP